jgi:hypothetical protein
MWLLSGPFYFAPLSGATGRPPSDAGDQCSVNATMIVLMLAGMVLGR